MASGASNSRVESSIVYIGIINHKNEPLYSINFVDNKLSTDLQLIMFSSLDYFNIKRRDVDDQNLATTIKLEGS